MAETKCISLRIIKQNKIGIKLRDAIIDYCINNDTINVQLDKRITN